VNVNRCFLAGNLVRDPQLKFLPSGSAVCEFGIAVNRKYKGKDGEKEDVYYGECVSWGKTAETINQYFTKGKPIFVEGRLSTESWTGNDGQKRSKTRIVVESFQFVGGPAKRNGGEDAGRQQQRQAPQEAPPADYQAPSGDDLPF
jgi:single-strand DNA-binding protein